MGLGPGNKGIFIAFSRLAAQWPHFACFRAYIPVGEVRAGANNTPYPYPYPYPLANPYPLIINNPRLYSQANVNGSGQN